MGDSTRGLYSKFVVTRTDGKSESGQKHHDCQYFVLDVDHDPHARKALTAYMKSCEADYPLLAADIRTLLYGCAFGGTPTAELGRATETVSAEECERGSVPPTDTLLDAERYRWLRKGNDYEHAGPMVVLCEALHIDSDDRPFWSMAEAALDAAIDEARGAVTKTDAAHDESQCWEPCGALGKSGEHARVAAETEPTRAEKLRAALEPDIKVTALGAGTETGDGRG